MDNTITVVYSTDDRYAWLAGISAQSLMANHIGMDEINLVILANDLSSENQKKLVATAQKFSRTLLFIDMKEHLEQIRALKASEYSSFSAYARLFIAELLPDISGRILYLDCDTLVCENLQELFDMPMHGSPIAMASDCLRNEYKRVVGIPENAPYYNSGVLLIDLDQWRRSHCKERVLAHMKNIRANFPLVDQDLINVVLHHEIARIHTRFNVLSQLLLLDHKGLIKAYGLDESYWISASELRAAKKAPAIYHFSGNTFIRPWFANSRHPMADTYKKQILASEWADAPLETFRLPFPYRVQLMGYRFLPAPLFIKLSAAMQRLFMRMEYGV